jgi:hypothetical protein
MGPKGSSSKWKWGVSMARLVLQARPFLKCYVLCILREISWFQGSLKGYKIKRRINGRIICRNRGCRWDLSKFSRRNFDGHCIVYILLKFYMENSFHALWNSYLFLPHLLITKLFVHVNLTGFCQVAHENYVDFCWNQIWDIEIRALINIILSKVNKF